MLISDTIDVALGTCLVFLMASLIVTAMQEALEGLLKMRGKDLERGITELLHDPSGSTITKALYEHPLIYSLYAGHYTPKVVGGWLARLQAWWQRRNLPSYIPAVNFSGAILDILARGHVEDSPYPAANAGEAPTMAQLRSAVAALPSQHLQRAILSAMDQAQGDIAALKTNLETYFNSTMERVSGWYKRRTQLFLFLIGLVMAAGMNVDATYLVDRLTQDKNLRQAVVTQAQKLVPESSTTSGNADKLTDLQKKSFEQLRTQLSTIGLPIGWPARQLPACSDKVTVPAGSEQPPSCLRVLFLPSVWMLVGWLISAFAVMLGAPFWFDALNKLVAIRGAVKPPDKSEPGAAAPPAVLAPKSVPPPAAPAPLPEVAFEPHSWASGPKNKGVL